MLLAAIRMILRIAASTFVVPEALTRETRHATPSSRGPRVGTNPAAQPLTAPVKAPETK